MKQLEVQIMGQGYVLNCPVGEEERLLHAAARVDAAMCKIRDQAKVKARERVAVLAALNLAFDALGRPAAVGTTHTNEVAQREGPESASAASIQAPPHQAMPAGHSAPAPSHPSPTLANQGSSANSPAPDLARMLKRLDQALGDDGQLL